MSEDGRVNQVASNDGMIIDQLLKEKGLTRQQVAERILQERREKYEAEQKAREEESKREFEESERLRAQHTIEIFNSRMAMTVDGRPVLRPLEELVIKCPKCDAPSEYMRYAAMVFAEKLERAKETSIGSAPGEQLLILNGPISMEGELTCRGCGVPMQIMICAARPAPPVKARNPSTKEIDST